MSSLAEYLGNEMESVHNSVLANSEIAILGTFASSCHILESLSRCLPACLMEAFLGVASAKPGQHVLLEHRFNHPRTLAVVLLKDFGGVALTEITFPYFDAPFIEMEW